MRELLLLLQERERRISQRKLWAYYPDDGPLRRDLYRVHMGFFGAGVRYRERCVLAANRIGKTEGIGGYETTLHLTGLYPDWWNGRRFDGPIRAWAAGDTAKTVRDIIQWKLIGPPGKRGTGLIPNDVLLKTTPKAGVPDAIETITVRHASGEVSTLTLKSYDQGRDAFQGTELDLVWLDEEPPLSIYVECLTRTMTTNGMMVCTFTPLEGLSDTVMHFLPAGRLPEEQEGTRYVCMATWDDAPHLTQEQKDELWSAIPPYQRDARSKGIPQLGSGAIYPVSEDEITCDDMPIPEHWPRAYALDVGWNKTAAIWGAWDRDSDIVYLYSEHYQGDVQPSVHAQAVQARGKWIPGVIDPAARGRTQTDGARLLDIYRDLGLDVMPAENAVEAGLYAVWQRLSGGRLKIFRSCRNLLAEMRVYRRDERGKVVKEHDHLCDGMRYLVMSGLARACTEPQDEPEFEYAAASGDWMGR